MLKLFKPLIEIAFFKRGPEILPVFRSYTYLVIGLYLLITGLAFIVSELPIAHYIPTIVLSLSAYALLSITILSITKKQERIWQTFTALVGTDVIITILVLPAVFLLINFPSESAAFQLGQMSYILTMIWSVAVIAVILNAATEWEALFGFLIAPAFFFSLVVLGQIVFRSTS
jgi:hypothetical protein